MTSTSPARKRAAALRVPGRRTALVSLSAVTAAGLALNGPVVGGLAAGGTDGVKVQTSQTVKANLTSTGKVDTARVFSQVAVTGNGSVDVQAPTSTQGL